MASKKSINLLLTDGSLEDFPDHFSGEMLNSQETSPRSNAQC